MVSIKSSTSSPVCPIGMNGDNTSVSYCKFTLNSGQLNGFIQARGIDVYDSKGNIVDFITITNVNIDNSVFEIPVWGTADVPHERQGGCFVTIGNHVNGFTVYRCELFNWKYAGFGIVTQNSENGLISENTFIAGHKQATVILPSTLIPQSNLNIQFAEPIHQCSLWALNGAQNQWLNMGSDMNPPNPDITWTLLTDYPASSFNITFSSRLNAYMAANY